jgi:hypothetical protein
LRGLFFDPEDGDYIFFRNVNFQRLHGVISQKIGLSNPHSILEGNLRESDELENLSVDGRMIVKVR